MQRKVLDSFDFSGFEPSMEIQALAKEIFWKVELNAPNQSFAAGVVSKFRDGYKGVIEVASRIGDFKEEVEAKDPSEVMLKLYKKIYDSLMIWKKSRPHAVGSN